MKTLLALLFVSSVASAANVVPLSYQKAGSFLNVSAAQIVFKGRQSFVQATVTFSNGCMAAEASNVIYAAKGTSNGDKLSVSLISLPTGSHRMCSMQYAPVDVTYVLPVNVIGPADQPLTVVVNGVVAR